MPKVQLVADKGSRQFYKILCPVCKDYHLINVRTLIGEAFNGDFESPTFTMDVEASYGLFRDHLTCHFYVRDGNIEFLPDCSHELAGKTVEMVEVDAGTVDRRSV